MSFKLTTFGGATLPPYEPDVSLDLGEAQDSIFGVPGGGIFDALGTEQYRRQGWALSYSGQYVHTSAVQLKASLDALNREYGKTQKLYRRQSDGSSQWVNARLMNVTGRRSPRNVNNQVVTCAFKVASPYWHGTHHLTTHAKANATGGVVIVVCTNGGNAIVADPVLTITARNTSVRGFHVDILPIGYIYPTGPGFAGQFSYSPTIAKGQTLTIDCGTRRISKAGTQAYVGFELMSSHGYDDWVRIYPTTAGKTYSTASIQVRFTGTSAYGSAYNAGVEWYEGWM